MPRDNYWREENGTIPYSKLSNPRGHIEGINLVNRKAWKKVREFDERIGRVIEQARRG